MEVLAERSPATHPNLSKDCPDSCSWMQPFACGWKCLQSEGFYARAHCKQTSSTVSTEAPSVSKESFPHCLGGVPIRGTQNSTPRLEVAFSLLLVKGA